MNRHVKMSVVMIVLILAVSMIFVGCKEVDEAKVELETKIADSVQGAIDTAKTDLEAAKADLNALIESGDQASAAALTAAIKDLNAAIDAAEKAAADADAADKATLEAAIATAKTEAVTAAEALVEAAKTELNATIAGNKTEAADALAAAVEALNAAIDLAEKTAADTDAADKAELVAAIATAKTEATDAAKKLVDDATKVLNETIAANKTAAEGELAKAVETLNAAIAAAETAAKNFASDEDKKLDKAIKDAQKALQSAVDAVNARVDAAVKDIADLKNDKVNASVYNTKIGELEAAIAELNGVSGSLDATYATDADVATKIAEAVATVNGVIETKTGELKGLIDANKTDITALKTKADELVDLIDAAKNVGTTAQAAADKVADDLQTAIADLNKKIADSATAAQAAYIAVDAWNSATPAVDAAIKYIAAAFDPYDIPALYTGIEYVEGKKLPDYKDMKAMYDLAWVKIVRAVDTAAVEAAKAEFDAYLKTLVTPAEVIAEELNSIGADETAVKCIAAHKTVLDAVKAFMEKAMANTAMAEEITDAGLDVRYAAYKAAYDAIHDEGEAVRDLMDVFANEPLSLELEEPTRIAAIDAAYKAWVDAGNEVGQVDGLATANEKYVAKQAEVAAYRAEGLELMAEINAWVAENTVIVMANRTAIEDLIAKYDVWEAKGNDSVNSLVAEDALAAIITSKENLDATIARVEVLETALEESNNSPVSGVNKVIANADAKLAGLGNATYDVKVLITDEIPALIEERATNYLIAADHPDYTTIFDTAALAALKDKFDSYTAQIIATYNEFVVAYEAIGTVTVDDTDAIENAKVALNKWKLAIAAQGAESYDYRLTDGMTPAATSNDLTLKEIEYKALVDELEALKTLIADLEAYTKSTDLVDSGARDAYEAKITAIETAYDTFVVNNGGTDSDRITDAEFLKIDTAWLAIYKFDTVEALKADAALWTAEGDYVAAVDTVITVATDDIDAVTVSAELVLGDAELAIDGIYDLASYKLEILGLTQSAYINWLDDVQETDSKQVMEVVSQNAIADILAVKEVRNDVTMAYGCATQKFQDIFAIDEAYRAAFTACETATNDAAKMTCENVYAAALNVIRDAETDGVDSIAAKELAVAKLETVADLSVEAEAYKANVDDKADAVIDAVLEVALADVEADATVEDIDVSLASYKFAKVDELYTYYQATLVALSDANLVALAEATYARVLGEIETSAGEANVDTFVGTGMVEFDDIVSRQV